MNIEVHGLYYGLYYRIYWKEPKSVRICRISKTSNKKVWQIIKTKHVIGFSKRKSEGDFWFESVKSSTRMHSRSRGSCFLQMFSVKFHSTPLIRLVLNRCAHIYSFEPHWRISNKREIQLIHSVIGETMGCIVCWVEKWLF